MISVADIRCDWGEAGIRSLIEGSDAIVIVDVLSFCTCVDVATARGVAVYPYRWKDSSAAAFAERIGAALAGPRSAGGPSLSPRSLRDLRAGSRLILPSPNGSRLSLATGSKPTYAACLRNAGAVAAAARRLGERIAVIPAGEIRRDGSLRFALEDWIGAGAVIRSLTGTLSAEARAAVSAFEAARGDLASILAACESGREIIARGYAADVEDAACAGISSAAPRLAGGAYISS
jgi:2-phosphosulfolactate phosphatase